MNKDKILANLETAVDKNGNIPMRLVRQAFEELPELCENAVSRASVINLIETSDPNLAERLLIHEMCRNTARIAEWI